MVGTQSVSFSAALRPAAVEILPPSRHGSGRQNSVRPVFAVERPRSAVDAAETFTPKRLKHDNADARRDAPRGDSESHGTDSQAAKARADRARAASAEILTFPTRGVGMASTGFVAQLIAQGLADDAGSAPSIALPGDPARQAAIGNDAYRRAGGEPAIYGEQPTYFRVAL